MNPTIRNNERFKYLRELPATSELYEFGNTGAANNINLHAIVRYVTINTL